MTAVADRLRVRYVRWDGVGQPLIVVDDTVAADPAPGWALAQIDLATICGSDLHTVGGRRAAPSPGILGHEQVGRIIGVGSPAPAGSDGSPVVVGDRVVWSVTASCGHCRYCARGLEQKCLSLQKYGHEQLSDEWPLSGGFATHCLLRPGTTVVSVPETIPDSVAAPASCATATVAAVLAEACSVDGLDGRRVLITGAGMLGVTAAAMAKECGAEVVVSDPDPARRARAVRFGAEQTADGTRAFSGFDVAIELSGNATAVETCVTSVDIGGRVVLAGSVATSRPVAVDPEHLVRNLITVSGVHNYRPRHLEEAIRFLDQHQHRYPFAELVDGLYGLDRIDVALHAASTTPALRQAVRPNP